MAYRVQALFLHSTESNDFAGPHFHLKMDEIIMKMQLNKVAVICLFVNRLASSNILTETVFSSESDIVIGFAFWYTVKKLLAK